MQQLAEARRSGAEEHSLGENTVSGAINITTVKPNEVLEGFAFLRPGTFGSLEPLRGSRAPS